MEKNKRLIVIAIICVLIFILFILYQSKIPSLNPVNANPYLEECKSLNQNSIGGTNLLFFSDEETTKKYSETLFSFSPLDQNNFNIYYIENYKPKCELYKDKAVLCYNEELIKKAASCPNDIIIAIQEENREIRSSAYMNVISINSKHPLTVIAHEFGHAFANLAEEYVPAKIPKGSKNCVDECSKFGDTKEGCYQGCSKADYQRSINEGIMRTLSSKKFGIFNENLILDEIEKKISTSPLTGRAIIKPQNCEDKKYYLIKGIYANEKISILDIKIEQGCVGGNGNGDFIYKQILEDKRVIEPNKFNPEFIFTTYPEDMKQGETYVSEIEFILTLPIIEQTQSLEIIQDNNKIGGINFAESSEQIDFSFMAPTTYTLNIENPGLLSYVKIDGSIEGGGDVKIYLDNLLILDSSKSTSSSFVTGYSVEEEKETLCGNRRCEDNENYLTCPEDCPKPICGNKICEDGENYENCDKDCQKPICGNFICEEEENYLNCKEDCKIIVCGNFICEGGENYLNCEKDCKAPICGNSVCEEFENLENCPFDCKPSSRPSGYCGDAFCGEGEDCSNCYLDCGICPLNPSCGNKVCEKGETYENCKDDCLEPIKIVRFENYCEETCYLNPLNLNKDSYLITIKINNAKLNLNKIKYKTISFE